MSPSTPVLDRRAGPDAASPAPAPAPAPGRQPAPSAPYRPPAAPPARRSSIRQLVVGLLALPLTMLPFLAYATFTPEGRLVRDRVRVALFPPTLPTLSGREVAAALAVAPRYEGAVMALAYHGIGSASDGEGGFVVSPERFAEHLATLKAAGMNAVTAAQVGDAFATGAPLPPNAVLLTFDDGRADAMMFADPLLKQAGMAATMFVIADAASDPGVYYASWKKIEAYARTGRWDIQSHTSDLHREHKAEGGGSLPMLTSRARGETLDEYRKRVRDDLDRAADAIENRLGRRPVAFAYPFGAYGADRTNDPAIRDVLAQEVRANYGLAFHQDDQETVPLLDATADRLGLRRLEVGNWTGVQLLERIGRAQEIAAAARRGGGPVVPAPEAPVGAGELPAAPTPVAADGAAPTAGSPSTAVAVPGVSMPANSPTTVAPARVSVPPATSPPTAVTTPPTTVRPPTTSPPPAPVVTSPPTTRPPTTSPPPTSPPPTSPPTTCKPAGNSGRCAPGQS